MKSPELYSTSPRARLAVLALGSLAAALVVVLALERNVGLTGGGSRGDDDVGTTWDPPSGWEDFQSLTVPPEGGDVQMEPDVDYLLRAPAPVTAPVRLRGGRHVVWIGGEIRIDDTGPLTPATRRMALVIADHDEGSVDGRVVHLEGLRLHGDDLAEGIDTAAPTAVVQLQNIRVDRVAIRGADDRDGTGGYEEGNHADIIQTWGGQRELRIDGLSGTTNYQGLFLRVDLAYHRVGGPIRLRNVDIEMVETEGEDGFSYGGTRAYSAFPGEVGPQFIEEGTVWIDHHPAAAFGSKFGLVAVRDGDRLVPDPVSGDATFADVIYPTPRIERDDLGEYGTWPGPYDNAEPVELFDWSGRGAARIYSGRPPGGDYVPADAVGLSYSRP